MNDLLPADRKYDSQTYMWVKSDSDSGNVIVGAGQPTLISLGDLAYVSLAQPGDQLRRGGSAGSMEAAKMTGDLVAPVSGQVVARNDHVINDPGILNRDPYEAGWLLEIAPDHWNAEQEQLCESKTLFESLPEELRDQLLSDSGG